MFIFMSKVNSFSLIIYSIIFNSLLSRVFIFIYLFYYFKSLSALADDFSLDFQVTASLPKTLGLFSVVWPIIVMLYSGWSPLFLLFLRPLVSLPSHLGIVPSAQITTGVAVTFIFHSLFSFLARSNDLCLCFHSFIPTQQFIGAAKSANS